MGDGRAQRGARRLMAERPAFAAVEQVKGLNLGTSMATRGGTWRCIWGGDCAG
jgi:hypothetical protein